MKERMTETELAARALLLVRHLAHVVYHDGAIDRQHIDTEREYRDWTLKEELFDLCENLEFWCGMQRDFQRATVDKAIAEDGTQITLTVRDQGPAPAGSKLSSFWCECEVSEFLCYPADGECTCGVHKHHVHCTCGGVSQVG
jgi:hypothetical protein